MTESTIKQHILDWLRTLKGSYWEISPPGSRAGKPDITGTWNGHYVAIEVKNEKGQVTKLQQYQLDQLRQAGATAFVARSLADVKKALL